MLYSNPASTSGSYHRHKRAFNFKYLNVKIKALGNFGQKNSSDTSGLQTLAPVHPRSRPRGS